MIFKILKKRHCEHLLNMSDAGNDTGAEHKNEQEEKLRETAAQVDPKRIPIGWFVT